jgi:hypothetical protein
MAPLDRSDATSRIQLLKELYGPAEVPTLSVHLWALVVYESLHRVASRLQPWTLGKVQLSVATTRTVYRLSPTQFAIVYGYRSSSQPVPSWLKKNKSSSTTANASNITIIIDTKNLTSQIARNKVLHNPKEVDIAKSPFAVIASSHDEDVAYHMWQIFFHHYARLVNEAFAVRETSGSNSASRRSTHMTLRLLLPPDLECSLPDIVRLSDEYKRRVASVGISARFQSPYIHAYTEPRYDNWPILSPVLHFSIDAICGWEGKDDFIPATIVVGKERAASKAYPLRVAVCAIFMLWPGFLFETSKGAPPPRPDQLCKAILDFLSLPFSVQKKIPPCIQHVADPAEVRAIFIDQDLRALSANMRTRINESHDPHSVAIGRTCTTCDEEVE